MTCLLCDASTSGSVWQQDKLRIDECAGYGVLFTAERPSEQELMSIYDSLITDRPDPNLFQLGTHPPSKKKEHEKVLNHLVLQGRESGELLDVGCFSGLFGRRVLVRDLGRCLARVQQR
jgi:hypothetical protein